MTAVNVQAFSDYVCPYCYLGAIPLERAAEKTGAQIIWRAFQLPTPGDPTLAGGSGRREEDWLNTISPMASRLGVEIRQPSRAPSTRMAHEAAAWARSQGRFDSFHAGLFRAHFLEDQDIGSVTTLKEVARRSGMDPGELERVLDDRRMAEEVDEDLLIAETYGVTVAPTFIVSGYLLQGAQDESTLVKAIELARDGKLDAEVKKLPHPPIRIVKG
jgi:predicted DsbA family dithiol-disulfide isomerase